MATHHVLGYNPPDKLGAEWREANNFRPYKPVTHLATFDTRWEADEYLQLMRGGIVAEYYDSFVVVEELDR